jgi:hypothetical protein
MALVFIVANGETENHMDMVSNTPNYRTANHNNTTYTKANGNLGNTMAPGRNTTKTERQNTKVVGKKDSATVKEKSMAKMEC